MPEDTDQTSFTDPHSRIMKQTNGGFDHCYNAQTAVDDAHQIIVATGLTNCAADNAQLAPMTEAVVNNLGQLPERIVADTGYRSEAVFEALAKLPCQVLVSIGREGRRQVKIDSKKYPHTAQMAERMTSDEGQRHYRRRKAIVEPPNGWIKSVLGFRQFSLRGLEKVKAEWNLVCLAINLRRMAAMA
ncbi:MAG: transposase [Xanthomonadales bacterium]|nr:transposase [Xanthomonadales bacterium]